MSVMFANIDIAKLFSGTLSFFRHVKFNLYFIVIFNRAKVGNFPFTALFSHLKEIIPN